MKTTKVMRVGVGLGGPVRLRAPRRRALLIGMVLIAASAGACGESGNQTAAETTTESVLPTPSTTPPATTPPTTAPAATAPAATTPPATTPPVATPSADDPLAPDAAQRITVGGMGADYAPPTRAVVDLGINVRRPSVREASDQATASAEALVAALTATGVPATAIQTSEFGINPMYEHYDYVEIVGYEVHIGYRATVSDVNSLGAVLAAAVDAGGDSVRAWGIRFEGDHEQHMEAARVAAWEDLRRRAESTAAHAGEPLGELVEVHEKVLVTSPHGMFEGGEGDSATFDIPVSPGQVGVVVLLTATYTIGARDTPA